MPGCLSPVLAVPIKVQSTCGFVFLLAISSPLEAQPDVQEAPTPATQVEQVEQAAETKEALARFEAAYALAEDEILKRVAPPFGEDRLTYYRHHNSSQAEIIPEGPNNMYFYVEDEKLTNWGMSFGGATLPTILRMLGNFYPQYIESQEGALRKQITGDFVVRPETPQDQFVVRLQEILREEVGLPYTLQLRLVEREVITVRGTFAFVPVDEQTTRIEIYGAALNRDRSLGGGGSGEFDEFLQWVGMWVNLPVIDETTAAPQERLSWHYNDADARDEVQRAIAKDPALVLPHLTEQTGLQFEIEKREVPILFVELNEQE